MQESRKLRLHGLSQSFIGLKINIFGAWVNKIGYGKEALEKNVLLDVKFAAFIL